MDSRGSRNSGYEGVWESVYSLKERLHQHRKTLRISVVVLVLLLSALLGGLVAPGVSGSQSSSEESYSNVEPRPNTTVIAAQNPGKLLAFSPDGELLYSNDTYDSYYDVDPHPAGKQTVVYSAIRRKTVNKSVCVRSCVQNIIERVNLSTGEVTRMYSRYDHRPRNSEWHDVDRVDGDRYLIADMADNAVFLANITTGEVEWVWRAQRSFDVAQGGPFPKDWTHLNDVESVRNGWVMISLRNQDQVVFVDPGNGVVSNWTLGADENYSILYEQHNPDYIPRSDGGPAVIVADSQNQRIIEYQRQNGTWKQTWFWRDSTLAWPRDADRLPNGNTLIADTHGHRVLEVDRSGDVIWKVGVHSPYDAERLETGDESRNGPSAVRADLASTGQQIEASSGRSRDQPIHVRLWVMIRKQLPAKLVNSFLFLIPAWIGIEEMMVILSIGGVLVAWIAIELWLSGFTIRSPVYRSKG